MVHILGEVPDLGSAPYTSFEPEQVADAAVWPLVDQVWGDDWRANSRAGYELHLPRRSLYRQQMVDAAISADCYVEPGEGSATDLFHSATLTVETQLRGISRELALNTARVAINHPAELEATASPDYDDEEGEWSMEWPEGDEDAFAIKRGAHYTFGSGGWWETMAYYRLEGEFGDAVNIPMPAVNEDGLSTDKLRLSHIEDIQAGLFVLRAAQPIIKALTGLREQPRAAY